MQMLNMKDETRSQRIKCPECLNYMNIKSHNNGAYSGECPVCKSVIFSKQQSPKKKIITITTK